MQAVDFVVLGVILLFENVSGWKLWKIGRDPMPLQKPNSYILKQNGGQPHIHLSQLTQENHFLTNY